MQRWLCLILVSIAAPCLAGCSRSALATHPVRGQVYYRDKPLAEALIVFHALDASDHAANKPIAYTDSEGKFTLTTMKPGDGAPAGEYAITVDLREAVLVGEEKTRSGKSLLPERYRNVQKAVFKFRVEPGENIVPRLDVKD
ncbi:MAG: hypothetical protein HY289_06580 [Planctomycetes bacterium]|nr:hypothetical protein [Planctomycetota bacterium]